MDKTTIIITVISTLFGSGGIVLAFLERRKRIAEAESKELTNIERILGLYDKALNDLEKRSKKEAHELALIYEQKYKLLDEKDKAVSELYERKIKVLEDEIRTIKRYVTTLKKENGDYRRRVKTLEANT